MEPYKAIHEFVLRKTPVYREVSIQLGKAARLKILDNKNWQILRNFMLSNKDKTKIDLDSFAPAFRLLKLSHHTEMEAICLIQYFTGKLGALAAVEIYKDHPDREKYTSLVSALDAVGSGVLVETRKVDSLYIKRCGDSEEGKALLVADVVQYINGPYRSGFIIEYADVDEGYAVGRYSYV